MRARATVGHGGAGLNAYHKILVILKALLRTTLQFRRDDVASRKDAAGMPGDGKGADTLQHVDVTAHLDATGQPVPSHLHQPPSDTSAAVDQGAHAGQGQGPWSAVAHAHANDDGPGAHKTQYKPPLARHIVASSHPLHRKLAREVQGGASTDLAHLALGPQELEEEGGRSLFMDSVSMQDVQDAVSQLDLSVLYGEVHGLASSLVSVCSVFDALGLCAAISTHAAAGAVVGAGVHARAGVV